jgi:hypothetical protein
VSGFIFSLCIYTNNSLCDYLTRMLYETVSIGKYLLTFRCMFTT